MEHRARCKEQNYVKTNLARKFEWAGCFGRCSRTRAMGTYAKYTFLEELLLKKSKLIKTILIILKTKPLHNTFGLRFTLFIASSIHNIFYTKVIIESIQGSSFRYDRRIRGRNNRTHS